MTSLLLASRYAQALYLLGKENHNLRIVRDDLQMIGRFLKSSEEFSEFLKAKTISSVKRQEILKNLFLEKISSLTLIYLLFLEHKGRLDILDSVCKAFEEVYLREENTVYVRVATAAALTDRQTHNLKDQLKEKYKKDIVADLSIDSSLIGGIKIRIGDFLHDHSIRGQLNRFKQQTIHTR